MPKIHVLPEKIANQIAAGEVVERPASIVKELIENALDARAGTIHVEISHGGLSLIRVVDDGIGMTPADAALSFQRHATSKISTLDDLQTIGSFGFRGEALPSIAAVSRVRLVTRPAEAKAAAELIIEGGVLKKQQDSASAQGTTIEVRDLFFNTPARRKFLKAETTELGHIQEIVGRLSLIRPDVTFSLEANGKRLLDLPAAAKLQDRAPKVLGKQTQGQWIELDVSAPGIHLTGLIGKPSLSKANRTGQVLFVNHRLIRASWISYALQAGMHGHLMEGRYPVAVIVLEVDGKAVDVNVHPTKQEVRLSGQREIAELIKISIRELLVQSGDLAPTLRPGGKISTAPGRSYTVRPAVPADAPIRQGRAPWDAVMEQLRPSEAVLEVSVTVSEPIVIQDKLRITKVLGQLHNTFLVAETEAGFILVDQHAAHERIIYEQLLKNLKNDHPERQMLLLDELLELDAAEMELFTPFLPTLTAVGFELELFGENTFVIRAVPAALGEINPVELLKTFVEEQLAGKVRTAVEDKQSAIAALTACKKRSVKAGDPMTPVAARGLLQRLAKCENPFNCPHGRPTFFSQTVAELEKQFKRI